METLLRDLRCAVRMLARAPGFAALAIVTLALGIGANTAIFTVANSVLLRPLAYRDPAQLVRISTRRDGGCCLSLPYYELLRDTNHSFSGVAAYQYDTANLAGREGAEQVDAERVTGNFFDVLGVKPLAGRAFLPGEDRPGSSPVALVGYELAARLFGDVRRAAGRHLSLDSRDYTIIGVLPPKFGVQLLGRQPEIWMTRLIDFSLVTPARVNRGGMYYESIGRLRPGVSMAQAQAETALTFEQYKHDKPANFDSTSDIAMTVGDLQANLVANVRPKILILSAAVAFVLLIACANVASLLLFRALTRRKEFAVRCALGAPRSRLVRQLLTESVLMAIASGALGILFGYIGTRSLGAFTATNLPQLVEVPMDLRVLAFTLAISVLSGIVFGLTPSMHLSRPNVGAALSGEGRGSVGSRQRNRARSILVTAQIALSTVLLIGSGLMIRSFVRLRTLDPGFDPSHTLTAQTFLTPAVYPTASQRIAFYQDALGRLQAIPGVESAAISTALPMLPTHQAPARFEGQPEVEMGRRPIVMIQSISPDYPRAMGVPLLKGRAFEESDNATSAPVALVNQAAVRRYWPNQEPVGKLVWIGPLPPMRVAGVLGDVKNDTLATPAEPEVFFPFPQFPSPMLYLTLRAATDPGSLASAVRAQITAVNRAQPVTDIQTMQERLASGSAPTRSLMLLIGVFSATALILAAVGIYGLIAYSVAQRTQELGLRMALGASPGDVLRLIVGNGLRLTVAGIAIGLAASLALTRLMASLLFQTNATDPLTFAGCALLFTAVVTLASYVPARRAMRINPTDALRSG
ncbi:MAG TPA: ABC transporter permease [Terriglobia bacterium]|nr:ABC transporter permease [Terriglobia bacterium]